MTDERLFVLFSALDAFKNELFSFDGIAPTNNLDPFAGLKIFIVLEEMLNNFLLFRSGG